jgi:hypothetical protein
MSLLLRDCLSKSCAHAVDAEELKASRNRLYLWSRGWFDMRVAAARLFDFTRMAVDMRGLVWGAVTRRYGGASAMANVFGGGNHNNGFDLLDNHDSRMSWWSAYDFVSSRSDPAAEAHDPIWLSPERDVYWRLIDNMRYGIDYQQKSLLGNPIEAIAQQDKVRSEIADQLIVAHGNAIAGALLGLDLSRATGWTGWSWNDPLGRAWYVERAIWPIIAGDDRLLLQDVSRLKIAKRS